jgi:aminoglycoside 6'-N-acetyltransferase I
MQIIDLLPDNETAVQQTAQMLIDSFVEMAPDAWTTIDEAVKEVRESFEEGRISRIALDDNGDVIGWIGGISQYDGNVWELHPLAVRVGQQGKGIGSALVRDFESRVRARGGLTILLGSDDEMGMTSLSGVDVYPDPLRHLAKIKNIRRHPFEFYQKLGFVLVGMVPDANGFGKPDIIMAKRIIEG